MSLFVDEFPGIHQIGVLLHVDAVGEEPQLAMADLKIVEVGAGDLHKAVTLV